MSSRLCDVPVYVESSIVVAAMVYAVVFAVTTCALAMRAYVHVFGRRLCHRPPSAAIVLAGVLGWHTFDTAVWVVPLLDAVDTYFRALMASESEHTASASVSLDLDTLQSPAPVLMCATPGFLAISILVGEAVLWWRVCALWVGKRAIQGACAVSLFVTLVFVGVTMGRLVFMKSPPTRLAVMFFVEPDGVCTWVSVVVSNVVQGVLFWSKLRGQRKHARLAKGSGTLRRLKEFALGAAVAVTFAGAFWIIFAASRREIWTTFKDDNPTRALWTFALFVATASCMRVPALVWWLPQSFSLSPAAGAAADDEGRVPRLDDPQAGLRERIMVEEGRVGGASYP